MVICDRTWYSELENNASGRQSKPSNAFRRSRSDLQIDVLPTVGKVVSAYYQIRAQKVAEGIGINDSAMFELVSQEFLKMLVSIWEGLGISVMGDKSIKNKLKRHLSDTYSLQNNLGQAFLGIFPFIKYRGKY